MKRVGARPRLLAAVAAALASACAGRPPVASATTVDLAAESYVRLVLALGERDADSLDTYHGPRAWQADARARHATLPDIQTAAASLAESLSPAVSAAGAGAGDVVRRAFLVRQLRALLARVDILRGARPTFADEARALFGLEMPAGEPDTDAASVRGAIDRLLPGRGDLSARYAAFDRTFLIASERLAPVMSRAIAGCREATRAHITLPSAERVDVEYVADLPWSAFTRYLGGFQSRIQVNAALPLTVDRALDLACHEAYPGHHTIDSLLESRFGNRRVEFLVQPLFSPQSLLQEAAASLASALAFPESARVEFERIQLFPLAGLDPADAERHVRVGRLVDQLRGVQAGIVRRYLDGTLDFPRASAALTQDALMPSADATLKFVNQYRTYAATYTLGRDALSRSIDARTKAGDAQGQWAAYTNVVTDPAQIVPTAPR